MKKVFILLGHTDKNSACGMFSEAYERGVREAGHEIRRMDVGEMKFDPVLHKGYKEIQELEEDLVKFQEALEWADHIAIFYPMWWSSMPAALKGLFDRAWLPGFAFSFNEDGIGWEKLLKDRSARVIITMDSWPLISRILFGDSTNEIGKAILEFAGIKPVKIKKIGPIKDMSENNKNGWKDRIQSWGYGAK